MNNMNEPTDGDPHGESRPTEQFWPMSHGSGRNQGPGSRNPGDPGDQDPRQQDPRYQESRYQNPGYPDPHDQNQERAPGYSSSRRPRHWTVGLVAAAALAIGGVAAGVSLAGHSSPAASTSGAAGSAAGPSAQAAALNTALNSAGTSGPLALTSSGSGASPAGSGACAAALKTIRADRQAGNQAAAVAARKAARASCPGLRRRLRRAILLRGIDGQFTFRAKGGTTRTLAFERGVVQSVSGSDIVVQATDGTTWTWDLVSDTVVREHGAKTSQSALASGETVWVGGPVLSGVKDARLVLIRPAGSSASSAPAPAPSASGSSASGSSASGS